MGAKLEYVAAGLVMAGALAVGVNAVTTPAASTSTPYYAPVATTLPKAVDGLTLEKTTWYMSGFGIVPVATFTIRSTNDYPTRDIVVECTGTGASGTTISRVGATIYDTVPAKGKKTFSGVNLGAANAQTSGLACRLTGAK